MNEIIHTDISASPTHSLSKHKTAVGWSRDVCISCRNFNPTPSPSHTNTFIQTMPCCRNSIMTRNEFSYLGGILFPSKYRILFYAGTENCQVSVAVMAKIAWPRLEEDANVKPCCFFVDYSSLWRRILRVSDWGSHRFTSLLYAQLDLANAGFRKLFIYAFGAC